MKILHLQIPCTYCDGMGKRWQKREISNSPTLMLSTSGVYDCHECDGMGVQDQFVKVLEYDEV